MSLNFNFLERYVSKPIEDLLARRQSLIDSLVAEQNQPRGTVINEAGVSTGAFSRLQNQLDRKQTELKVLNRFIGERMMRPQMQQAQKDLMAGRPVAPIQRPEFVEQSQAELQRLGVLNPFKQFFTQQGIDRLTSGRTDVIPQFFSEGFTPFSFQPQAPVAFAQQPQTQSPMNARGISQIIPNVNYQTFFQQAQQPVVSGLGALINPEVAAVTQQPLVSGLGALVSPSGGVQSIQAPVSFVS